MINELNQAFPSIIPGSCLVQIQEPKIGVYDCPETKKCKIQTVEDGIVHFTIHNKNQKQLSLLCIDNCVFSTSDTIQRCDFAVFDTEVFCFVELKNPLSRSKIAEHRKKARQQLLSTIKHFQERLPIHEMDIEAYICLGTFRPRPAAKAQDLAEILAFEEIGATLIYNNSKEFS